MRNPLIDKAYNTGMAPAAPVAPAPVPIITEYDLTETVEQREHDYITAFCVSGMGHTFTTLEYAADSESPFVNIDGRDVVECIGCGTIVVRPKPKKED